MLVTLLGIVMLVNPSHSANAIVPILTTPLLITTFVKLQQPKALSPMLLTLAGIVMLFIKSQLKKAELPMAITLHPSIISGTTNSSSTSCKKSKNKIGKPYRN